MNVPRPRLHHPKRGAMNATQMTRKESADAFWFLMGYHGNHLRNCRDYVPGVPSSCKLCYGFDAATLLSIEGKMPDQK